MALEAIILLGQCPGRYFIYLRLDWRYSAQDKQQRSGQQQLGLMFHDSAPVMFGSKKSAGLPGGILLLQDHPYRFFVSWQAAPQGLV